MISLMFHYRDLEIYKEAKKLAIEIHEMSLTLPKFEMYETGSQIRRSSRAVSALIVEGYGGRRYRADFIKHLIYAHVECDETSHHLDCLFETKSLADEQKYHRLKKAYIFLSKRINCYTEWVEHSYKFRPDE
jgi:four helix bundle protein